MSINQSNDKKQGIAVHEPHPSFKKKKVIETSKTILSKDDVPAALSLVISTYTELYGFNKDVLVYSISDLNKVVVIEDSLVVDFRAVPIHWRSKGQYRDWEYPYIMIQELMHNDLFRFNYADFSRRFDYNQIWIDFYFFHGLHYYIKEIDVFDDVNNALPELQLAKRIQDYPGELHHFVILRMEGATGETKYTIGDTKNKVHTYILKLCKEMEEKATSSIKVYGISCLPHYNETYDFIDAFLSWKSQRKRWRLENKFSYYYEDKPVKNDLDIDKIMKELLKSAIDGAYDAIEFGYYTKPLNRWKSEELVYNITKKLYKDYQVIYQYRPYHLSTNYGQMSYDIYICGLKTAIEYQGKQHFEPVDFFGGQESFQKQQIRDKLKAERSKQYGVKLVYINYWEEITADLIRQRVEKE